MKKLSYSSSGVSINKGNEFVSKISNLIKKDKGLIKTEIGGFSGQFPLSTKIKKPILVGATDGVGTKIQIAEEMNDHKTIGIDLVAMCVNDLIVDKATPLFFLDYISTGKLNIPKAVDIIKGIIKGCKISHCALLGGETAEHPGYDTKEKYDLAGFCVGVKSGISKKVLQLKKSDLIIGIESSGIHSNGFSLIRKIIKDNNISLKKKIIKNSTLGKILLKPTHIYVDVILDLFSKNLIKTCSHITGGGVTENLPRSISKNTKAVIDLNKWKLPAIFKWISSFNVSQNEMLRTFNCGYGMVIIIDEKNLSRVKKIIKKYKFKSDIIGNIDIKQSAKEKSIKFIGRLNLND